MDEVFGAATMVTALLFCLCIFHCPCQLDQKLLCHTLNSTRVITLWILTIISIPLLSMYQVDGGLFGKWLVIRGKKLVVLSLDGLLDAWVLELWDNSIKSSFSASLVALR